MSSYKEFLLGKSIPAMLLTGAVLLGSGYPSSVQALTLEQAVKEAVSGDPAIVAAQARSTALRAGVDLAARGGMLMPQLSGYSGVGTKETSTMSTRKDKTDGFRMSWRIGMNASIPLYDFGKTDGRVSAAEAHYISAQKGVLRSKQDATMEIIQVYADLWSLGRLLGVADVNVARHEKLASQARPRYNVGALSRVDVDIIEGQLREAEMERHDLQGRQTKVLEQWRVLTGSLPNLSGLEAPRMPKSNVSTMGVEALVSRAAQGNPELLAAMSSVKSFDGRMQEIESSALPVIALEGDISFDSYSSTVEDTDGMFSERNTSLMLMLRSDMYGQDTSNQVAEVVALKKEAQARYDRLLREVEGTIRFNMHQLSIDQINIANLKRKVSVAKDSIAALEVELANAKTRAEARSALTRLQAAYRNLVSSEAALVNLGVRVVTTSYNLLRAVGSLNREFGI